MKAIVWRVLAAWAVLTRPFVAVVHGDGVAFHTFGTAKGTTESVRAFIDALPIYTNHITAGMRLDRPPAPRPDGGVAS